jgi:hypothetical protein
MSDIISLENDNEAKIAYFSFVLSSILFYFLSIMSSTMLLMTLSGVVRDSDKLRVFMRLSRVPLISIFLFSAGYFTLVWGLSCAVYVAFGTTLSIIFASVTTGVGGIIPILLNNCYFLKIGHVIHYWYKHDRDDFLVKIELKIN